MQARCTSGGAPAGRTPEPLAVAGDGLSARVERLEGEVAALREQLDALRDELGAIARYWRSATTRPHSLQGQSLDIEGMEPPVAQREATQAPAVPPLEPSTRFAARVGSGIFASLGLLLACWRCCPAPRRPRSARFGIPAACGLAALALHINADELGPPTLQAAAALGTLLVSANLLLSDGPRRSPVSCSTRGWPCTRPTSSRSGRRSSSSR